MRYLLFILLTTKAALSWSMDTSCSEQDVKLSDKDLGIIELRENSIKTEALYTLSFPSSYKGLKFSSSTLLIGTAENGSLVTELQTEKEGERLTAFVWKTPNLNEEVSVGIRYGQCLTQTIRLP